MTQATVSKALKGDRPKEWALFLPDQPHRAHNNTTTMQYETKTHKMHTNKQK